MTAFRLDQDQWNYTLLIDGWFLDRPEPVVVRDQDGTPIEVGESPYVRVLMYAPEVRELWTLLDSTIGANQREGERVKRDFESAKRQGLDTDIPTKEEYDLAVDTVFGAVVPDETAQKVLEAADVIRRYTLAHVGRGE